MWASTSSIKDNGTKYNLSSLDFIINHLGITIEILEDISELDKDRKCEIHYEYFLKGITNGEYIYATYEIIHELTSDKAAINPPFYKQAILYDLINGAGELFRDTLKDDREWGLARARDCWELYKVCCENNHAPLWIGDDGEPITPPKIDALSIDDWEYVCQVIKDEFISNDDWRFLSNYKKFSEKPPKPTEEEYKMAKAWLLSIFYETRLNRVPSSDKSKKNSDSAKVIEQQKRNRHELFEFLNIVRSDMLSEYQRIQKRASEDPGTAGDQGEENWAAFLRQWLPANYPVVTKGRILTHDNWASPQVDIIVLYPHYPLHLRDKKVFFAGGVAAAFECKLTLRNNHIKEAFRTGALIKRRTGERHGNIYDELQQPLIYGLLAHSHSWKKRGWKDQFNILERIMAAQTEYSEHPRELLDVICVADTATYCLDKFVHIGPHASRHSDDKDLFKDMKDGGVATGYCATGENENESYDSSGEVLGKLILEITKRLAYEDSSLQPFVDYLYLVAPWSGIGRTILWDKKVFTKETLKTIMKKGYNNNAWSKWSDSL